jgi:Flp pilus assembly pilin Flp
MPKYAEVSVKLSDVRRNLRSPVGQGLAEYALILGLIAVVAILALTMMGNRVDDMLSVIANVL